MPNLLKETIEVLRVNGKALSDIRWIGSEAGYIDMETFGELANICYENRSWIPVIAIDLMIVGDDWWLERIEYNDYERWDFKTMPTMPTERLKPKR